MSSADRSTGGMSREQKNCYFIRILTFVAVVTLLMLLSVGVACAHKLIATAWVEGATVYVESGFSDGSTPRQAQVIVFDDAGQQLLEGKTGDQGEFSFPISRKSGMTILVNAGMGHQTQVDLPLEEFDALELTPPSAPVERSVASEVGQPGVVHLISAEQLQIELEKALDKKLRPIIRKLAAEEQSGLPPFKDIMAGIGYIVGLVGAGAYFNYRRKQG